MRPTKTDISRGGYEQEDSAGAGDSEGDVGEAGGDVGQADHLDVGVSVMAGRLGRYPDTALAADPPEAGGGETTGQPASTELADLSCPAKVVR